MPSGAFAAVCRWAIPIIGDPSQASSPLADINGSLLADEVETTLQGIWRPCPQFAEKRLGRRSNT